MTESCLSILSSSWARVESRDVLRVWRVIFIISSVSSILPFFRRAFIMGIVMPVADIAASLLKTLSRRLYGGGELFSFARGNVAFKLRAGE